MIKEITTVIATLSVVGLMGCSNPPSSISPYVTTVERKQGGIWIRSAAGAFNARPGLNGITAEVLDASSRAVLSRKVIQVSSDRSIPETELYRIPEGERKTYKVRVAPEVPPGSPYELPLDRVL